MEISNTDATASRWDIILGNGVCGPSPTLQFGRGKVRQDTSDPVSQSGG